MSDNIPFEIQEEIIKRVSHVKSLIRFRSVSKQWKSLIDNPEFIIHYTVNQTQPHYLLVSYKVNRGDKYVSIVDDDSFPRSKFYPTIPPTVKLVAHPLIIGCSHGLVCSYGSRENLIVVWNPSIRKSVGIKVEGDFDALGFGVCPKTYDPKIVKIFKPSIDYKAEVFTLSSGAWRSVSVNPGLHREPFTCDLIFNLKPVVINAVIYWSAYDNVDLIISFNLISEEFEKVDLPDGLQGSTELSVYKLKESLALVYNDDDVDRRCDVWVMKKDDDLNSVFEKLFTLSYDDLFIYDITGFRMNGQSIILQHYDDYDEDVTLKVYDPSSQHMNDLEIDVDAVYYSFFGMTSYTESLIMLNQPATIFQ